MIVLGGANDIRALSPSSSRNLSFNRLTEISEKTNIILCTIPYRYDHLARLSTNISYTNQGILFHAKMNNLMSLDLNNFLFRRHFTRHGLHLNNSGKYNLANKIVSLLSEFQNDDVLKSFPTTTPTDLLLMYDSDILSMSTLEDNFLLLSTSSFSLSLDQGRNTVSVSSTPVATSVAPSLSNPLAPIIATSLAPLVASPLAPIVATSIVTPIVSSFTVSKSPNGTLATNAKTSRAKSDKHKILLYHQLLDQIINLGQISGGKASL